MSYSELMLVEPSGDVVGHLELRNSHGHGPFVWGALVNKYKRLIYPNDPILPSLNSYRNIFTEWEDLWKKAKELPLRWWEWNALHWTYDYAMFKRENFEVLAESLRRFEDAFALPGYACHCLPVAEAIDELLSGDDASIALCMMPTSVSESPWTIRYMPEPTDDDPEPEHDYRPYNITRDDSHWFVECRRPGQVVSAETGDEAAP